jgi:hypothetical protein
MFATDPAPQITGGAGSGEPTDLQAIGDYMK